MTGKPGMGQFREKTHQNEPKPGIFPGREKGTKMEPKPGIGEPIELWIFDEIIGNNFSWKYLATTTIIIQNISLDT